MKKRWWLPVLLLAALVLLSASKPALIFRARLQLEDMTACALGEEDRFGHWLVHRWYQEEVLFEAGYLGLGSAARMRGFCYSPTGEPSALGNDRSQSPQGRGTRYTGDGDNWTYLEPIADHWFWFEMNW